MKAHLSFSVRSLLLGLFLCTTLTLGQNRKPVLLPAPQTDGGKPLMQALRDRQSTREFDSTKLPPQLLSNLLWAAFGINRPDSGKRTAPSARNWQEVDVYAIMEDGAYLYDAKANILRGVAKGDLRKLTGTQEFVSTAPLNRFTWRILRE